LTFNDVDLRHLDERTLRRKIATLRNRGSATHFYSAPSYGLGPHFYLALNYD
jgi:hypothetical protein